MPSKLNQNLMLMLLWLMKCNNCLLNMQNYLKNLKVCPQRDIVIILFP
uniref:Uncharacterized protein n=1 Tax=Arundo donax TaxID=35708 RepID=A0A0A8Z5D1_ARUDO